MQENKLSKIVSGRNADGRETGSQLLELLMALTILTVGAMGFLFATQANLKASRSVGTNDLVSAAFMNAMATLRNDDFEDLHDDYDGESLDAFSTTFTSSSAGIGQLVDADGDPAKVYIAFHVNETNLPAEYGPVLDLDGDGALTTTDVSDSYDLLPTRLTLTFQGTNGIETRDLYVVLGRN